MTRFYLASAYHLPCCRNAGADLAKKIETEIALATGWEPTAHWHTDFRHGETWYAGQAAATDLEDIRRADILIFAPLTETSRGTHVELGFALALGKRVLGWRPEHIEGTAFDTQTERVPGAIERILVRALENHRVEDVERAADEAECERRGLDSATGRPLEVAR
ncbi:MAG TPA: nucleoside 2-deoxyribosyltransferase [Thermoplasmata archaeon]|nr:nucleoside 2-deoxyribosyltransferase [Thermoplasmata archaeon]